MQQGELFVSGKNSIRIPLEKFPSEVKCHFKHEAQIVPCNPGEVDYLEYEVHCSNTVRSGYILLIKWKVSAVREVVYRIFY